VCRIKNSHLVTVSSGPSLNFVFGLPRSLAPGRSAITLGIAVQVRPPPPSLEHLRPGSHPPTKASVVGFTLEDASRPPDARFMPAALAGCGRWP